MLKPGQNARVTDSSSEKGKITCKPNADPSAQTADLPFLFARSLARGNVDPPNHRRPVGPQQHAPGERQAQCTHTHVYPLTSPFSLCTQVGLESAWRLSAGQADVDLVAAIRNTLRSRKTSPRLVFYDCRSQLVAKVTKV